ncbi:hypothetical protein [Streptomyces flaveolus]|uniref:hypothetical protein n=1 Tax=Streptomyces flaveolus TaxID=67297 RepID=UPI0036C9B408
MTHELSHVPGRWGARAESAAECATPLVTAVAEVRQPQWVTFADSLLDTGQSQTRRRRPVGFLTPGPTAPVLVGYPHLATEPLAHGTLLTRPEWCGSPARRSVSERR